MTIQMKMPHTAQTSAPTPMGARGVIHLLLLVLCILLASGASACSCNPPPTPDAGDSGGVVTPDPKEALKPPASWGAQKMSKGQACGAFKWGDLGCEDGLSCVKSGGQGMCLQSCDPKGEACPSNLPCQEVNGTWACLTKTTLKALGEECTDLPCQPPLACVRAGYETTDRCRQPCDPHPQATNKCPAGFLCGILPSGGGTCVPRPEGTVEEFGKCAGTNGLCKNKPTPLECVIDSQRSPVWGSCLRLCGEGNSCPDGLVCITSVGACAKPCDPDAPKCEYGTCQTLAFDQNISVCY